MDQNQNRKINKRDRVLRVFASKDFNYLSILELGDKVSELAGVGTLESRELDAVEISDHGGHSLHSSMSGGVLIGVDIDLGECDVRVFVGEFLENGGDNFAWSAPGGVKVDDHLRVAIDVGFEFRHIGELFHVYNLHEKYRQV